MKSAACILQAVFILQTVLLSLLPHIARGEESRLDRTFESVEEAYGIVIIRQNPSFPETTRWGKIEGENAAAKDIHRYERLFCEEFSLYPQTLIQKTKLRRVVLCGQLKFVGQRRYAVPDFEHDTYYLDVGTEYLSASYLRHVIHHDFFHIVDYQDDGRLYEDERWKLLNPPDFRYGNGGAAALNNPDTGALTNKYPGFLTHYSTTGVEEDKAEVFSHLIVSRQFVEKRVKEDQVLKEKVDLIRTLAGDFCEELDQDFWKRAGQIDRTE